jgi:hypothetical protein
MRQTETLTRLKQHLRPGQVYRRADLMALSSNVDRHLARLVAEGHLKKLSQGMYAAPKPTAFGEAPPESESLLRTFLKDDHFVVYSPSQFNSLGLGTTQLYNRLVVFNRKRVGEFTLGGRTYSFHRWREAPRKLTPEFLVVELLNRLAELAEDRDQVLMRLKGKLPEFNRRRLLLSASRYGTLSTQKKLERLLENGYRIQAKEDQAP